MPERLISAKSLLFDSLFDTLPSGMLLLESDGIQLRLNQKAREILGLDASLTIGVIQDLSRGELAYLKPLAELLQNYHPDIHRSELTLNLPGRDEASIIGFSLKLIHLPEPLVSVSSAAVVSEAIEAGHMMKVLTFSDITQVVKDRLTMDKIKDELNQSKKLAAMGTLIAGVAHEMNNPLTGISMSASLLKMNLERLKKLPALQDVLQSESKLGDSLEKALLEIQKIARSSERAGILVSDLLSYAKPSQIFLAPMVLHELVADTVNALRTHPRFTQFTIELADTTERVVLCDRVKLEQVFYNLLKNACDATDGKGTVHITYEEIIEEHGKPFVIASVRDNGPGIDKVDILHIFDPFFTTKGHGGVGLGLSICYRTMEQHGGLLSVESVKGEGTEFKVKLPVYLEGESEPRFPSL